MNRVGLGDLIAAYWDARLTGQRIQERHLHAKLNAAFRVCDDCLEHAVENLTNCTGQCRDDGD